MNEHEKIGDAILKINSSAKYSYRGETLDSCEILWYDGTPPISKADIKAQFSAVEFDNSMAGVREKRNAKLAETDFYGLSDNTMSADMTTYRQELRDLTNGVTTVEQANAVVFPTKP
jgi:hypothetical protein